MAFMLVLAILAGGAWFALTLASWIEEGEKEGIVNRGYVGEDKPNEGKTDL